VHLTPREQERILLAGAAALARRRLERGALLGATEAIALVCDEICEMAWDGLPLETIIEQARKIVRPQQLLDGVAALVPAVQVEALFPHGTALVHIDAPFGTSDDIGPGAVRPADGVVELAVDRDRRKVELHNTGDRDVWISSHYPLDQLNPKVVIGESLPAGFRLDLPAGEAVVVGPGEVRTVAVVAFGPFHEGESE
jgi:urease subunit gamma/beta